MNDSERLSADEAADLLDVAPRTLAKWRQTGNPDLPYLRINDRIRYRAKDVQAFLQDCDSDEVAEEEVEADEDEDD